MSLQRRLTLFFVVIVVIPLAAAGWLFQRVVVGEMAQRAELSLDPALVLMGTVFETESQLLDMRLTEALDEEGLARVLESPSRDSVNSYLRGVLDDAPKLDFVGIGEGQNTVVGWTQRVPDFAPGVRAPSPKAIFGGSPTDRGYVRTVISVKMGSATSLTVVGGLWLDRDFLPVTRPQGVDLSIVSGTTVIASTATLDSPASIEPGTSDAFDASLGGPVRALARPLEAPVYIVASSSTAPIAARSAEVIRSLIALLALAVLGTILLAYLLARLITRPLEELSEGANAITRGSLDHRIPIRSNDEVGRVAVAFNEMTEKMNETFIELRSSRDLLHRAVRRVGEAMRSTNDMRQMLDALLQTAADAVEADAALLWMFTSTRDHLYVAIARGLDEEALGRVKVGDGIAGLVAERATTVVLPAEGGGPRRTRMEPDMGTVLAIPLFAQDRVLGVLAVYRAGTERPFSESDRDTAVFLTEQGSVAVENLRLHEEAQRLAITDGLTGVWNRRYFQMQFRQVAATAQRFEREFSILMLDLDRFKDVNDTHGHQRGDHILVEFAQRVSATLREVDTFARYGGEEFVCLLFETDVEGATSAAEKIREEIRATPFGQPDESPVALTVSIGVATFPQHGGSFRTLVEAADKALYVAKQEGRDCVRVALPPSSTLRLA